MKGNSFLDCMIISSGGKSCRASDLGTKKDPFVDRPKSVLKGSYSHEEMEGQKNAISDGKVPY